MSVQMHEYLTGRMPPSFLQEPVGNLLQFGIARVNPAPNAYSNPTPERISSRLAEAIRASRYILDLEDDWDEEGSPRFDEATWRRAIRFVKQVALSFRHSAGFWIEPPRILPGPKGSIDIHWKTTKRELLINIPKDEKEPADYYGSGSSADIIKGKIETSANNEWILAWLTK